MKIGRDKLTKQELLNKVFDELDIKNKSSKKNISKKQAEKLAEKLTDYKNKECYFCRDDKQGNLEEHHIVPKRLNGSNNKSNLVTLCKSCHNKLENLYTDQVFRTIYDKMDNKELLDFEHHSNFVNSSDKKDLSQLL